MRDASFRAGTITVTDKGRSKETRVRVCNAIFHPFLSSRRKMKYNEAIVKSAVSIRATISEICPYWLNLTP